MIYTAEEKRKIENVLAAFKGFVLKYTINRKIFPI